MSYTCTVSLSCLFWNACIPSSSAFNRKGVTHVTTIHDETYVTGCTYAIYTLTTYINTLLLFVLVISRTHALYEPTTYLRV